MLDCKRFVVIVSVVSVVSIVSIVRMVNEVETMEGIPNATIKKVNHTEKSEEPKKQGSL